eukprot:334621-Pleurochrysis_carterae.AAC.1
MYQQACAFSLCVTQLIIMILKPMRDGQYCSTDWLQLELGRTRKTSKSLGQRQLLTLAILRFYGSAKDFTSYTKGKAISGVL